VEGNKFLADDAEMQNLLYISSLTSKKVFQAQRVQAFSLSARSSKQGFKKNLISLFRTVLIFLDPYPGVRILSAN
jgi:flagellar basal body rod protein FlgF